MKKHQKKSFLEYCTFHQIQPSDMGSPLQKSILWQKSNIWYLVMLHLEWDDEKHNFNMGMKIFCLLASHTINYYISKCNEWMYVHIAGSGQREPPTWNFEPPIFVLPS